MSAPGFRSVLANPRYLRLWLAQLVSQFGDFVALMALFGLVAFRRQGSAHEVSGILFAFILPLAVLGPLAGVLVDRWDLKRTMIASDLVRAALAALLVWAFSLPQIYALVLALSAVSCFFLPAQTAALPLLVPRDQLLAANALNAQAMQINKVAGPALAGALVATLGEKACFLIDAATFVVSASLLATIRLQREAAPVGRGLASFWPELREGVGFVFAHRSLAFATAVTFAALVSTGVFDALVAVYVRDVLAGPTQAFTSIVAVVGAGTILGALLVGRLGQTASRERLVAAGIAGIGAGILGMAVAPAFLPAVAGAMVVGLGVAGVVVGMHTMIQEDTPAPLLGRVGSAILSLTTAAKLVGIAVAGALAARLGLRGTFLLVSAALLSVGLVGWLRVRALRPAAAAPAGGPKAAA